MIVKRAYIMKLFNLICVLLVGIFVTACTDENQTPEYGKGEGCLILSGMKVETVVGDVITRASLDEAVLPSISDFTIKIVNTEGNIVKTLQPGTLQCKLNAGNYIVKAVYGDADVMSYIPAFYGEKTVNIIEGNATNVSIEAKLVQTVINPQISTDLAQQLEECKLTIARFDAEPVEIENDKDFFIPSNGTYTLTLSGINKLGESFSHSWEYENLAIRTRYIVECNPDLPAFTLPEQSEGNVWSKFIYITPMTEDNMTAHKEDMAQKVMDNIVYEASSDGLSWIQSQKAEDGKIVIKNLQPSTTYTIRSRFGAVNSSNTQQVTTESAQQLENGDMENWSNQEYTTYGLKSIYLYYVGNSSTDKSWGTKNTVTMAGVENGTSSGTSNQITAYRWNSCTIPTDDAVSGKAAEIRTMALATIPIVGTEVGTGIFWSKNNVANVVKEHHKIYNGYLYTGNIDIQTVDEEPNKYGISHFARPLSLSFSYKYSPFNGDNCLVYAKIFDRDGNEIAYTEEFKSQNTQSSYNILTLDFNYKDLITKASSIFILFQSGEKETWDYVMYLSGDYKANPWSLDTFVGSVLKVDNVTLNYDL